MRLGFEPKCLDVRSSFYGSQLFSMAKEKLDLANGKTTESQDPKVERQVISASCHLYISYRSKYITDTQCVCRMVSDQMNGQMGL
jgi:hypothetical protein